MLKTTTKTLALALIAGSVFAGSMATPSFARDSDAPRPGAHACHHANCKHVKKVRVKKGRKARKRSRPWAQSYDPATGRRITSIGNGDGTRTVIGTGAGFGPFGIQIWISN